MSGLASATTAIVRDQRHDRDDPADLAQAVPVPLVSPQIRQGAPCRSWATATRFRIAAVEPVACPSRPFDQRSGLMYSIA